MKPGDEDEAWRQIVEHYGDTPSASDLSSRDGNTPLPEETSAEALDAWDTAPTAEPEPWSPDPWTEESSFVPPPTPPFPWAEPKRLVAWLGVFVAPALMLLSVLGLRFPGWLSGLLVVWFAGGFVYLVATMPRGGRDPWDDGSRI